MIMQNPNIRSNPMAPLAITAIFIAFTLFFLPREVSINSQQEILVLILGVLFLSGAFVMGYKCHVDPTDRELLKIVSLLFVTLSMMMIVSTTFFVLLVDTNYLATGLFTVLFIGWEVMCEFGRTVFK